LNKDIKEFFIELKKTESNKSNEVYLNNIPKIDQLKCNLKIYYKTRTDSIDIHITNQHNITNQPNNYTNTEVQLVFNKSDTINLLKDYVSKLLNISAIFIHIYFDEEKIVFSNKPTPYRLSNGLLLWNSAPKNVQNQQYQQKADLSKIGFKTQINKGWSSSIPIEVKLEHLYNCNILDYIAIVEV